MFTAAKQLPNSYASCAQLLFQGLRSPDGSEGERAKLTAFESQVSDPRAHEAFMSDGLLRQVGAGNGVPYSILKSFIEILHAFPVILVVLLAFVWKCL